VAVLVEMGEVMEVEAAAVVVAEVVEHQMCPIKYLSKLSRRIPQHCSIVW